MRTWKVTVQIYSLVGREVREIEVVAKTEKSARKIVTRQMGNRDYSIQKVEAK